MQNPNTIEREEKIMKKRVLGVLLSVAMVMVLAACGDSSPAPAESATEAVVEEEASVAETEEEATAETVESTEEETVVDTSNMGPSMKKIYERGYVLIGCDTTFPPFSFQDPATGEVYGVMVEFGNRLAEKLGVDVKYQAEAFGTLLSDLTTDKVDLVAAGVTVTEERKEIMMFTDSYIATADTMVVRTEDIDKYTDLDSFKGKTISANNGTSQMTHAETIEGATVIGCDGTADAILQLVSGSVDACIVDNKNGKQYVEANKGAIEMVDTAAFESNDKAVAAQLGNEDLVAVCNEVIAEMKPSIDELVDYYTKLSVELLGV